MKVLILSILMISCGTDADPFRDFDTHTFRGVKKRDILPSNMPEEYYNDRQDIDPELLYYVESWEDDMNIRVDYDVVFTTTLDNTTNGQCFIAEGYFKGKFSKFSIVMINRDRWNKHTEFGKEMLMYHEFGHCSLDLEHNNNNGSLMYPYHSLHRVEDRQEVEIFIDEFSRR